MKFRQFVDEKLIKVFFHSAEITSNKYLIVGHAREIDIFDRFFFIKLKIDDIRELLFDDFQNDSKDTFKVTLRVMDICKTISRNFGEFNRQHIGRRYIVDITIADIALCQPFASEQGTKHFTGSVILLISADNVKACLSERN